MDVAIAAADTAGVLAAMVAVAFMVPGLALFYGGMVSIRSTLGQGTTTVLNVQLTNHWPKAPEPVFDHDHAD